MFLVWLQHNSPLGTIGGFQEASLASSPFVIEASVQSCLGACNCVEENLEQRALEDRHSLFEQDLDVVTLVLQSFYGREAHTRSTAVVLLYDYTVFSL